MPKEALFNQYYFKPNGEPDTSLAYLGDCIAKNLYFLLRPQVNDLQEIRKIFFEDLNFSLELQRDQRIASLGINYIDHPCHLFDRKANYRIEKDQARALRLLKQLLDQGNIVFTGTVMCKVPFYKTYSGHPLLSNYYNNDNHRFLIIWYQEDSFYFVENYENLVTGRYTPYEKNYGVGIIKEAELAIPFEYFARLEVFDPNFKKLIKRVKRRFGRIIEQMIINYYQKERMGQAGLRKLMGRAAILEFIKLCESGTIALNENPTGFFLDIMSRFERITVLGNHRRNLLKDLLIHCNHPDRFQKIIEALDKSFQEWNDLKNGFRREYLKRNYIMGEQFKSYFINVLQAEDQLFQALEAGKKSLKTHI